MERKGGQSNGNDQTIDGVPLPAARVGFKEATFYSTFNNDVDTKNLKAPGFNWYLFNWFGGQAHISNITITPGISAVFAGELVGPNGNLTSAAVNSNNTSFIGTVFGGGGYFEATLSFDPTTVHSGTSNGWPSWWTFAIEHAAYAGAGSYWPGQVTGYWIYNETDIMEYIWSGSLVNSYDATIHTHYNTAASADVSNNTGGGNVMPVASYTQFNSPHKYGVLWLPGSASTTGSLQYFFDRQPIGSPVIWSQFVGGAGQTPPPVDPWRFGIIDSNHIALVLGTGPSAPLTVYNVQVWQANSSNNIKH